MPNDEEQPLVLNMKQAAKQLDVCLQVVYNMMHEDPPLPTIKIGTRRVIRRAALEQWLIDREKAQQAEHQQMLERLDPWAYRQIAAKRGTS